MLAYYYDGMYNVSHYKVYTLSVLPQLLARVKGSHLEHIFFSQLRYENSMQIRIGQMVILNCSKYEVLLHWHHSNFEWPSSTVSALDKFGFVYALESRGSHK